MTKAPQARHNCRNPQQNKFKLRQERHLLFRENMPLLTELFILFGLNYKDAAPTALNAAFFWIQEHAGQKLKREIKSKNMKKDRLHKAAPITS